MGIVPEAAQLKDATFSPIRGNEYQKLCSLLHVKNIYSVFGEITNISFRHERVFNIISP